MARWSGEGARCETCRSTTTTLRGTLVHKPYCQVGRCGLCGGNAGQLNAECVHNLCAARAKLGLPTPSLGERCATCGGRGSLGRGGVPLDFDLGPAVIAGSITAQFPPCATCGGKGYTGGPNQP